MKTRLSGPGAELLEVRSQQGHEFGVDRYPPGVSLGPMLEPATLAWSAVVGPPASSARFGIGEPHLSPSFFRQDYEVF